MVVMANGVDKGKRVSGLFLLHLGGQISKLAPLHQAHEPT